MAKRDPWKEVVSDAEIISATFGGVVERSSHAYEIATVKAEGVSLIIYPHKTSGTNNISARARDNGSKNKTAARAALIALKQGQGLPTNERGRVSSYNTFYCKTLP